MLPSVDSSLSPYKILTPLGGIQALLCFALVLGSVAGPNGVSQTGKQEQSSFGSEEIPGEPLVKQPVPVPVAVSEILKGDEGVKSCLEDNPLPAGEKLSSWFIASAVHLSGSNETDLVVLANPQPGESYSCFHSVTGISWFWVFRQDGRRYELLLRAACNGLKVLKTRNNGYRNLQTVTLGQAGGYLTTTSFRFDGKRYQKYRESTQEQH